MADHRKNNKPARKNKHEFDSVFNQTTVNDLKNIFLLIAMLESEQKTDYMHISQ